MNEEQYITGLEQILLASSNLAMEESVALATEAVEQFPDSRDIWHLRGDLFSLHATFPQESGVVQELCDGALASYERAIELDPNFSEAYESLGYLFDAHSNLTQKAEFYFREALRLGNGPNSYIGLSRVLAEQGRKADALDVLSGSKCPYANDESVNNRRLEIESGEWDPIV